MFRVIPGYPDYRVNCFGVVQSRKIAGSKIFRIGPWRTLKQQINRQGYFTAMLWAKGIGVRHGVHRLVAWAFHGPQPQGIDIRHLNGNKKHNFANNLAYGTRSQNVQDSIRHGDIKVSEKSWRAKLTNDDVREIRRLASTGIKYRLIGSQFGVGRHYVAKIACGEIWKHLD